MVFQSLFQKAKAVRQQEDRKKDHVDVSASMPPPALGGPGSNKMKKNSKDSTTEKGKPSLKNRYHDDKYGESEREHSSKSRKRKLTSSSPGEASKTKLPGRHKQFRKANTPVASEALALSQELKLLARQKRLDEAFHLYHDVKHQNILDQHHACIMLDCYARSSYDDTATAEQRIKDILFASGKVKEHELSIETQTARLKCYVHSGMMHHARYCFRNMIRSGKANVRSLNTYLRGCLWSATTVDKRGEKAGGVVAGEEAWHAFLKKFGEKSLDVSSFEYSVTLLSQALELDAAEGRIEDYLIQMDIRQKGKASFVGGTQSSLETLAVMYHSLTRAYSMKGEKDNVWKTGQLGLNACKLSMKLLEDNSNTKDHDKSRGTGGGKRAWKHKGSDQESEERREESNKAYRRHRLSEIESDLADFIKNRENLAVSSALKHCLEKKLFYISGGAKSWSHSSKCYFDGNPNIYSFGLRKIMNNSNPNVSRTSGSINSQFERQSECLDIEIGSGFGEWIVNQAKKHTDRNHIAVETRADRVYQIFSRSFLAKPSLENLLVVGSDARSFLSGKVEDGTVSTIFVNHPEPPTQTYGNSPKEIEDIITGKSEPSHILNSETISVAVDCLKPGGRLVILTDNRHYASLLMATAFKLSRTSGCGFHSAEPKNLRNSNLRVEDTFRSSVYLFEGQPDEAIGHATSTGANGASYFDRLWRSGASSYAHRSKRYILVLIKD